MNADVTVLQIALYKPDPGAPYYNTMQRWMGKDVASRGGWRRGKNFQKIIGGTVIDSQNVQALPDS